MAKTETTKKLESDIYVATKKMGVFACFEVTIGIGGNERVDYLTYDTKGIWRCYEIKATLSDFRSSAKKSFVGHYNYYVLTKELYERVKVELPDHVGVYVGQVNVKRPKKQELGVDVHVLKDSMIRSLTRDSEKLRKVTNPNFIERTNTTIKNLEDELRHWKTQYNELRWEMWNKKNNQ